MSNSQNVKIARELVRIAKKLMVAGDEENFEAHFIIDDEGNEKDVSSSQFSASFLGTNDDEQRVAKKAKKKKNPGVIITFSTDVNAVSENTGNKLYDACTWLKNKLKTMRNRNQKRRELAVDEAIQNNQDRTKRDYNLGASIVPARGIYHSNDSKGRDRVFRENSYLAIIVGATKEEGDKIANYLGKKFDQESVMVNYFKDIPTEFLIM